MRRAASKQAAQHLCKHLQLGEVGDVERAEAVEAPHHLCQRAQHGVPHHARHTAKPQDSFMTIFSFTSPAPARSAQMPHHECHLAKPHNSESDWTPEPGLHRYPFQRPRVIMRQGHTGSAWHEISCRSQAAACATCLSIPHIFRPLCRSMRQSFAGAHWKEQKLLEVSGTTRNVRVGRKTPFPNFTRA